MRKFLGSLIAAFAKLVTLPLSPMRRREARAIAHGLLLANHRVETERGRLIFDSNTRYGFRRAWQFPGTDPDTLGWLNALPDDGCYWDIGASIGAYSLYAALRPKLHVLAFEPSASSYAVLNRNIELNDMSDRIAAYCIAFSEKTNLDTLNMARTEAGVAMHGFGTEINHFDRIIDTRFRQGAVGFSIDGFMKIFSPRQPTHVKIDVDGIEADILRGGRNTLSAPSVKSMMVEIVKDLDSARNRQILTLMTELGFTARPKTSPEIKNVIFDRISA